MSKEVTKEFTEELVNGLESNSMEQFGSTVFNNLVADALEEVKSKNVKSKNVELDCKVDVSSKSHRDNKGFLTGGCTTIIIFRIDPRTGRHIYLGRFRYCWGTMSY